MEHLCELKRKEIVSGSVRPRKKAKNTLKETQQKYLRRKQNHFRRRELGGVSPLKEMGERMNRLDETSLPSHLKLKGSPPPILRGGGTMNSHSQRDRFHVVSKKEWGDLPRQKKRSEKKGRANPGDATVSATTPASKGERKKLRKGKLTPAGGNQRHSTHRKRRNTPNNKGKHLTKGKGGI